MTDRLLEEQLASWDGIGVVTRYHRATGSWIFIALHDNTLGRPTGGTRMHVYPSPAEGLADAQRLAEGMTHKWAAIDLPFGGGKAVLAIARELSTDERNDLLAAYGSLIAALRGAFATGPDLGTTPADMMRLAGYTDYVHGVDKESGVAVSAGPYTAKGVFAAIGATAEHSLGRDDLSGVTVLVQGLGAVGEPLCRQLAESGARLKLADLHHERAGELAAELDAEVVALAEVAATPCDIYAPCAIGGVLNGETIPRLACRAVAGSANNQLAEPEDAERLARRGILYAPDYIANGGGALGFALRGQGVDEETIADRLTGIGDTLKSIFRQADQEGESPLTAAHRHVCRVLERGPR